MNKATPLVLAALETIRKKGDRAWCFSDMDCADGGTSLDLWRTVINTLRERDESEIQIIMTLPQYYNSVEELSAPLLQTNSAVYKAGLRLVDIHTAVVSCPFAQDYRNHIDAEKFASTYIPTIRSWNESIFLGALSEKRTDSERREIIKNYYAMYQRQVANTPEAHGMAYVHAYMTLEKIL